jgi:hypothetical protein
MTAALSRLAKESIFTTSFHSNVQARSNAQTLGASWHLSGAIGPDMREKQTIIHLRNDRSCAFHRPRAARDDANRMEFITRWWASAGLPRGPVDPRGPCRASQSRRSADVWTQGSVSAANRPSEARRCGG